MAFKYKSSGGGSPIRTSNEITNWGMSTCEGAAEPQYHKGEYPADRITHKWPEPKGERTRYNDSTPPRYSESGSNYSGPASGSGSGLTASPKVNAPKGPAAPSNRGLYRKSQDRFDAFGRIGSGEGRKMRKAKDV